MLSDSILQLIFKKSQLPEKDIKTLLRFQTIYLCEAGILHVLQAKHHITTY